MAGNWEEGYSLLQLERDHIPWEHHQGLDVTLNAMNKAFEIYYRARQMAGSDMKMHASIRDSFTDGSGRTVADDLQEAFQYLSKRLHLRNSPTEYWWGDMYRKTYRGRLVNGSAQVPKSIYEFLTSVENKMIKVVNAYNEWGELFTLAEKQKENEDWENFGKTIGTINSAAGSVKHLLWLAPKSVQHRVGGLSTIASVTGGIHGAATAFADGNLQDWAQMRLATEVLGKLPILGQFYGSALEAIPSIKNNVSAMVKCKVKMLDKIDSRMSNDFRDACQRDNKAYTGNYGRR